FVELRIRIRQWQSSHIHRFGELAHSVAAEKHVLESRQVVQKLRAGRVLDLCVGHECAERLLLQRAPAPVELISTGGVGATRPWVLAVWASKLHIEYRSHHAPHVYGSLTGGKVREWVNQLHVRRQIKSDPDQSILPKIAEVARVVSRHM